MADPARIMEMASAFYQSQVLFSASDLGIFGALADLPDSTAEELAEHLGCDPRGTRLLLDGCCAVGLLCKHGDTYANSAEAAAFLVPGMPGDLSRAIRYNRDVYAAWGKLPRMVRDGKPVEAPTLHLGDDAERTRTFVLSMHGRALGIGRMVVPHLELTGCRRLLDVGGGPGTYSALIAQAHPRISCTVIDLPAVTAVADELLAQQQVSEQVKTLAGDYHEVAFPAEQDAVLFFGMLHQEEPEGILALLRKAHAALKPGGIVYILDMMTDASHTSPPFSALFALNMALTTHHGWVFSDHELHAWLIEAGFQDFSVAPLPPPMPHWLASARRQA